ncbi:MULTISPECIES: hypothetical protein [Clostridium]|uniref:hypothetical protein n=1 Tax=Clostridium TaxID=1485 RepID=UPI00290D2239|nr:hypothetical protein [Clostridium sp.]MDU7215462.1 hypothetical protein [Clostridium sp.]
MALKEIDLGNVRGPQGPAGPNAVSTTTTTTGLTNGHFLYSDNGRVGGKAITPATIGALASNGKAADSSKLNNATESTSGTANTIAKRDSNGDLTTRFFKSSYPNQNRMNGAIAYRVNDSTDNNIRFCSDVQAIRNWLGVAHEYKELKFFGNVKQGVITIDKTKITNGVKVSFMTSNKMGTDKWYYAINGKYVSGWTMHQEAKYCFDFTKLKPDSSVWMYETIVANPYRDTISSRRYDGGTYLHIGELNSIMVYLEHDTNVCDNLTALIEYY